MSRLLNCFIRPYEWMPPFLGILFGFLFGIALKSLGITKNDIILRMFGLFGNVYLNAIKLIIPLFIIVVMIRTSIGLSSMKNSRAIILASMITFFVTSMVASLIPVVLMQFIDVMNGIQVKTDTSLATSSNNDSVSEIVVTIVNEAFPNNFINSLLNSNALASMIYCTALGLFISKFRLKKIYKKVIGLIECFYNTINGMFLPVIYVTPIGVFCIVLSQIAVTNGLEIFGKLEYFVLVFVISNLIINMIFSIAAFIIYRSDFLKLLKLFADPFMTGISISSSTATIPQMLVALKNFGFDDKTSDFYMTISNSMLKIGPNIYFIMIIIFASNYNGNPLDTKSQFIAAIFSVIIMFACPSIPMGTIIYSVAIGKLFNVDVNSEIMSVIITIDPIMDRIMTISNIYISYVSYVIVVYFVTIFKGDHLNVGSRKPKSDRR